MRRVTTTSIRISSVLLAVWLCAVPWHAVAACFSTDGLCDASKGEECVTCPEDCGACAVCGDSVCDASEDCWTCPGDCGSCSVCGDGICMTPETCTSCSADCGACPVCGDSVCDRLGGERCDTCAVDCGACPVCGDAVCDVTESCGGCPADCICTTSFEQKPLIMILFDTSGSMEYLPGPGKNLPVCDDGELTQCAYTPQPSHTRSRAMIGKEVLTGRIADADFMCCSIPRTSQEPDPDIPVHFEVPMQVPQAADGVMDVYREDVRFGLMTYDAAIDASTGNSGGYSYGPDVATRASGAPRTWNWGAKNAAANRGYHAYNGAIIRATGALQAVAPSPDLGVMAAANDKMQEEVRWLFPYGRGTPLAAMIDDARSYILDDGNIVADPCKDGIPMGVIVVTDGHPSFDACYTEDPLYGWGTASPNVTYDLDHDGNPAFPLEGDCNKWYESGKYWRYPWWYYQTSERMAAKLLDDTGFLTFVIGFVTGPESDTKLRLIAEAGGTCRDVTADDCYQHADSYDSLYLAYDHHITTLLNLSGIRSMTRTATTSRTSFRGSGVGLYEVAARFRITNRMWRGNLERVTFQCDEAGALVPTAVDDFADTLAAMSPASRQILTSAPGLEPDATPPTLASQCDVIAGCDDPLLDFLTGVGQYNGTPVLGDIRHSSPIIAVAPELDTNVPGYRQFRRDWGERDTMVYVGANDGMLHAFVLADLDQSGDEGREAWAFVPRAVHDKLQALPLAHQNMVDATPVVADVRLYRDARRTPAERWATVLVGGLRAGGRAWYALDVTNPEAPRYLWELAADDCEPAQPGCGGGAEPFSRLGLSYGMAALGSVALADADGTPYEAAIAIIPGGFDSGEDAFEGRAIFIVELATGRLLRVFDATREGAPLDLVTGSPAAAGSAPGSTVSRFYVGDSQGRLLRGDLASSDPSQWAIDVFYDPVAAGDLLARPEAVHVAPALAFDRDRNLVVVFGTGDTESLEPVWGRVNLVASVTERRDFDLDTGEVSFTPVVNWVQQWSDGGKLTGAPEIFNHVAYFPTLHAPAPDPAACGAPFARLWATHFKDSDGGALRPVVDLDGDGAPQTYTDFASNTVIFGVEVAPRPHCVRRLEVERGVFAFAGSSASAPQLILQTSSPPFAEGASTPTTTTTPVPTGETIHKVRIDLPKPLSSLRGLSWAMVYR